MKFHCNYIPNFTAHEPIFSLIESVMHNFLAFSKNMFFNKIHKIPPYFYSLGPTLPVCCLCRDIRNLNVFGEFKDYIHNCDLYRADKIYFTLYV